MGKGGYWELQGASRGWGRRGGGDNGRRGGRKIWELPIGNIWKMGEENRRKRKRKKKYEGTHAVGQ